VPPSTDSEPCDLQVAQSFMSGRSAAVVLLASSDLAQEAKVRAASWAHLRTPACRLCELSTVQLEIQTIALDLHLCVHLRLTCSYLATYLPA
jgi:hypothetical protein